MKNKKPIKILLSVDQIKDRTMVDSMLMFDDPPFHSIPLGFHFAIDVASELLGIMKSGLIKFNGIRGGS